MSDDREREDRARRLIDGLRSGKPFEAIFPVKEKVTPAPDVWADHHLDFVASVTASPHGGSLMRNYLMDCQHASGALTVLIPDGVDPADAEAMERMDGEVLDGMLKNHRTRTGCQCWPKGWARAEVA